MIVEGYSYDIFKQISPQKIRLYLTSCGWNYDRSTKFCDIFSNPDDGTVVTVPNNRDYSDYAYRVEEIVRDVSASESLPVQRVITGMTISASTDIIEYHYEPESGEVGLIPIPDILHIISAGNDLNNYAYRDIKEYRESYANSNWKGRKDLDSIRLGPTIPGSYVVQFVYPMMNDSGSIGTDLHGAVVPDNGNLSQVCDKIESSLESIIDAAERNRKELEPEDRISYNFVSTVMELGFDKADMDVRRIRTLGKTKDVPKPQILSKQIFSRISAIETNMRPDEMRVEQDFIGRITMFKDPREEVNDDPADISVTFIDTEGKACSATLSLNGDDLNKAYDASKARQNVKVSGTLVGGKYKRIIDVKGFSILG